VVGVARQLDGTVLTVGSLRGGHAATRALLPRVISPAPVHASRKPAPVAPAESLREAAELLGELLAVPSEGWHALAAAMSQELFDGLKRWHAACLAKNRPVVSERHPVIACVARWWVRS